MSPLPVARRSTPSTGKDVPGERWLPEVRARFQDRVESFPPAGLLGILLASAVEDTGDGAGPDGRRERSGQHAGRALAGPRCFHEWAAASADVADAREAWVATFFSLAMWGPRTMPLV